MRKRESVAIRMSLNILQLNCRRFFAVMNDLSVVLTNKKVNVALLQEVYVSKDHVCGLPSP